ncbi:MAG: MFS transporter [Patescibacteria group bacterium]
MSFLEALLFISAVLDPFFKGYGGLNQFELQLVQGWFLVCVLLFEVPTGVVADLLGRKWSMMMGAFCTAAACILYPLHTGVEWFLIAETVFGLGAALSSGAGGAWITDTLNQKGVKEQADYTHIFARVEIIGLVAIMIAALIGSRVAIWFDITYPVYLSAISVFLAGCIALFLKEPERGEAPAESRRFFGAMTEGVRYVFRHRELRKAAVNMMLLSMVSYFTIWFYQPMLNQLGIEIGWFGVFHSILILVEIGLAFGVSMFERIIGRTLLARLSALLIVLSMATTGILWLVKDMYGLGMVAVLLMLVGVGAVGFNRRMLLSAYVNEFSHSHNRATVNSAVSMIESLGVAAVNPLAGWLFMVSPALAILLLAGIGLIGVLMRVDWKNARPI